MILCGINRHPFFKGWWTRSVGDIWSQRRFGFAWMVRYRWRLVLIRRGECTEPWCVGTVCVDEISCSPGGISLYLHLLTRVEKPLPFPLSKQRLPRTKAPEDKSHWLSITASGCELTAERSEAFLVAYVKADASRRGCGVVEGRGKWRGSSSRRPRDAGGGGLVDGRP
jgi:hypothetical protein